MKIYLVVCASIAVAQGHTYFHTRDVLEPRSRNIVLARDLDLISAGFADCLVPLTRRSPEEHVSRPGSPTDPQSREQRRDQVPPRNPPALPLGTIRNGPRSQEQSIRNAGTTSIPRVGDEHGPNAQHTIDQALAGAAAVASRNNGPPSQVRLGLDYAFSRPLDMRHIPSAAPLNTPRSKFDRPDTSRNLGASSNDRQQSTQQDSSGSAFRSDARSPSSPTSSSER